MPGADRHLAAMNLIRRAILALALIAGLSPALAQVPAPVPALPDTERRTPYSITASTCACAVNFALYGDGTDYQSWVEVFINGVRYDYNDASHGWTITSPSGPLSGLARPITNAVLTFNAAQTGTVQIVGARRPRRAVQLSEGGVTARSLNQALTDIISQNRELWDKTSDAFGRVLMSQPGVSLGLLPTPAACANNTLMFDATGTLPRCNSLVALGALAVPRPSPLNGIAFWNDTNGTQLGGLATANNGVLVTSAGGVPSISTTLPSGLSIPSVVGLVGIGPGTPDTGISTISTGNRLNIFEGSLASPTTSLTPSVFIYRNESISGPLNGYSAALNVGATGTGIVGGYQTQAIVAYAAKDVTSHGGDVAGILGSGIHYGSVGSAFGGFFAGTNAGPAWSFALETQNTNGSGIDYPYQPTAGFFPIAVGLDLSYGGSYNGSAFALGSAGIIIRAGDGQLDVGIGFMAGNPIKTADIQTDTNAANILYAHAGSHINGINLTGASFSNCSFSSSGFCTGGIGDVTGRSFTAKVAATSGQFIGMRANGTLASPTTLQNGEAIAELQAKGYDGSAYSGVAAQITAAVTGGSPWSNTNHGSLLQFWTTPFNSTTLTLAMQIGSDQSFFLPAGKLVLTNIAAPSAPSAGTTSLYVDSTDLRFHDKNASGVIGTTVVADTGAANNYISAISTAGAITKSRPACATLSDAGAFCSGTSLTSLTGAGTGVLTALGVNVGSAGSFVTNGGALGTPSSGVATNLTGTASGLTAGNVTTNANLTGDVTSVGNATTLTNAPVIAKVLTGFASGAGTVSASDSILSAFQKINGNDALKLPLAGGTMSGAIAMGGNNITGGGTGSFTTLTGTGGTHTGLTGLGIRDTSAAFDVTIAAVSSVALSAGRTLTVDMVNAARTLKLGANLTLASDPGAVTGALKSNGTGTFAQAACSDLSNGTTACSTSIGTSGAVLGLLNANKTDSGSNTWSALSTFQNGITINGAAYSIGVPALLISGSGSNEMGFALNNTNTSGRNWQMLSVAGASGLGVGKMVLYDQTTGGTAGARMTIDANGVVAVQPFVAIPAAGSQNNCLQFSSTANFGICWGSGAPTLSMAQGSLYLRSDGTANNRLYINTNGSTTWTAFNTAS